MLDPPPARGRVRRENTRQDGGVVSGDVPDRPFDRSVLDCLPGEGAAWVVPPKSAECPVWRGREDLRELLVFTIDPPGAWCGFHL